MLDVAVSQTTTPRWDLPACIDRLAAHGFRGLGLWRPRLPDAGLGATAAALAGAGIRVSSLRWAGGFTGSDGRSFVESVDDATEAVAAAAELGGAGPRPPVLVLHSGCRGGHTRTHAARLLLDALALLAPVARREGVVLAIEPLHAAAAPGCSFLTTLDDALRVVAGCGDDAVRLSLDAWHFGDAPDVAPLLPRLAGAAALVRVADRCGPPSPHGDRLPAGRGTLPLEAVVAGLVAHGYEGDFEFDPVGEAVETLGYDAVLGETRRVADAWRARLDAGAACGLRTEPAHAGGPASGPHAAQSGRALGAGSRRSQASSHVVSRG